MNPVEPVVWLPIPGFEDRYEVSSDGRVRTVERVVKLLPPFNQRLFPSVEVRRQIDRSRGPSFTLYEQVLLNKGGRRNAKTYRVHRLVLLAFVGPLPDGMESRHSDGNSLNNRISNLSYDTHQKNMNDRAAHGNHHIYGEENKKSKLTEEQVLEIRSCLTPGIELARRFGVTKQSIYQIRWGKVWKHLLPSADRLRRAMGNAEAMQSRETL